MRVRPRGRVLASGPRLPSQEERVGRQRFWAFILGH